MKEWYKYCKKKIILFFKKYNVFLFFCFNFLGFDFLSGVFLLNNFGDGEDFN